MFRVATISQVWIWPFPEIWNDNNSRAAFCGAQKKRKPSRELQQLYPCRIEICNARTIHVHRAYRIKTQLRTIQNFATFLPFDLWNCLWSYSACNVIQCTVYNSHPAMRIFVQDVRVKKQKRGLVLLEPNNKHRLHGNAAREAAIPLLNSPLQNYHNTPQIILAERPAPASIALDSDAEHKIEEQYIALVHELRSLEAKVQRLKSKQEQSYQQELCKNEWKVFATIIGRLTGLLFLLMTTLLTVVIFLRTPNYDTNLLTTGYHDSNH